MTESDPPIVIDGTDVPVLKKYSDEQFLELVQQFFAQFGKEQSCPLCRYETFNVNRPEEFTLQTIDRHPDGSPNLQYRQQRYTLTCDRCGHVMAQEAIPLLEFDQKRRIKETLGAETGGSDGI